MDLSNFVEKAKELNVLGGKASAWKCGRRNGFVLA